MLQLFYLQAHEVWREKLARNGAYAESGDLSEFVLNKWSDGHFVWCCYSPLRGENQLFGYLLFRPKCGPIDENFFVAKEIGLDSGDAEFLCRPAEFAFGEEKTARNQMEAALVGSAWGRIFYLDEHLQLRCEDQPLPCDWGIFIAANGVGLWKWAMRDGVNWNKAGRDGIFRWHDNPDEAERMLAGHTSSEIWEHLEQQLKTEESEMAFALRWLQLEYDDERFDVATIWKNGSRVECELVFRWLLLSEQKFQLAQQMTLEFPLEGNRENIGISLAVDGELEKLLPRFKSAVETLSSYFGGRAKPDLPLCAQLSYLDLALFICVEEPTAHERVEARLQLEQWCAVRNLAL